MAAYTEADILLAEEENNAAVVIVDVCCPCLDPLPLLLASADAVVEAVSSVSALET